MTNLFLSVNSFLNLEARGILPDNVDIYEKHPEYVRIRQINVDWLTDVHKHFSYCNNVLYVALHILDAYIAKMNIVTNANVQLWGLTALNIAAKKEGPDCVTLADYVKIAGGTFSVKNMMRCEKSVFKTLNGDFNFPTIIEALRMLNYAKGSLSPFYQKEKYISEICLSNPSYLLYPPSVISTAIHAYCCYLHGERPANIFKVPIVKLAHCITWLFSQYTGYSCSGLTAVEEKYAAAETPSFSPELADKCIDWLGQLDIFNVENIEISKVAVQRLPCPIIKHKLSTISAGSFGIVYKVETMDGDIMVFKKAIIEEADRHEGLDVSMLREISALQLLQHPNVVKILGFNRHGLFMESASLDLRKYMNRCPFAFSVQTKQLEHASQLIFGLDYLHNMGVIHRDIKTTNILVFAEDGATTLKYGDFGSAHTTSGMFITANATVGAMVTLWYRPPELLLGAGTYDHRVDVWSLGCVLYEMIEGSALFRGKTTEEQLLLIFENGDMRTTKKIWNKRLTRETHPLVKQVINRCLVPSLEADGCVLGRAYTDELITIIK